MLNEMLLFDTFKPVKPHKNLKNIYFLCEFIYIYIYIYIYICIQYTQHTIKYYVKTFIFDVINRLTALIKGHIFKSLHINVIIFASSGVYASYSLI